MIYWIAGLCIVLFAVGLRLCRVDDATTRAFAILSQTSTELFRPALTDLERERIAQNGAKSLLLQFFNITFRLIVSLAAPAILIAAVIAFGVFPARAMTDVALSWPVILAGTLVFLMALFWRRKS